MRLGAAFRVLFAVNFRVVLACLRTPRVATGAAAAAASRSKGCCSCRCSEQQHGLLLLLAAARAAAAAATNSRGCCCGHQQQGLLLRLLLQIVAAASAAADAVMGTAIINEVDSRLQHCAFGDSNRVQFYLNFEIEVDIRVRMVVRFRLRFIPIGVKRNWNEIELLIKERSLWTYSFNRIFVE
uniref:Secreted protein n=1 Tax=Ananas comosus var. bracteatus TaxID=296719 RepID=A0A6V7PB97_ANACO|nr:unnamed protein product [Ananas comosus var. bracteatus]